MKIGMLIVIITLSLSLSGCVSYPTSISDIMASGHSDIDKVSDTDIVTTFASSGETLFNEVIDILKEQKLILYQKSKELGYIIAMGFPKQTDTTRVGIYFKPKNYGTTVVTLSSLSTTALIKADKMILEELKKNNSTL